LVGQPVQLERTPSTIARAAPRRGEHTEEVLAVLGPVAAEIQRLRAASVF
jgi:formyl-CoA transferase